MTAAPEYRRPEAAECAPFHLPYVGEVSDGDVLQTMERQLHETTALLETVPADKADFAYASGKWSIKQVVGHLLDAERIFAYRALRIARGDLTPLPGFDEKLYVPASGAERRTLIDLLAEFHAVRRASLALFHHLPAEAATRTGIVSGVTVSVRALAWVITGHELHHVRILRTRYLV